MGLLSSMGLRPITLARQVNKNPFRWTKACIHKAYMADYVYLNCASTHGGGSFDPGAVPSGDKKELG